VTTVIEVERGRRQTGIIAQRFSRGSCECRWSRSPPPPETREVRPLVAVPGRGPAFVLTLFSGWRRSWPVEPGPPNLSVLGFFLGILSILLITLVPGVLPYISVPALLVEVLTFLHFGFFRHGRISSGAFGATLFGWDGRKAGGHSVSSFRRSLSLRMRRTIARACDQKALPLIAPAARRERNARFPIISPEAARRALRVRSPARPDRSLAPPPAPPHPQNCPAGSGQKNG
jgi:hypothetical protein